MKIDLTAFEARVIGCLIEKQITTPDQYPLSLNALTNACNQKSNREPLMTLEADDVERIIEELRALGAVTEAPESTRVAKFRHRGYEWLGVQRAELAVMTELLLRGEQTLGELRSRAARMEPIADLSALKPIVDALVKRRLMIELTAPAAGRSWSHNLYGERELADVRAHYVGHHPSAASFNNGEPAPATAPPGVTEDKVIRLSEDIRELRAEVARLRERIGELESKLTPGSD